jgi:DNA-binding CsgD family transcriptional regulator
MATYAEKATAARGDPMRVRRVLERSWVPMVLVDDERRYVEVNAPSRLALGLGRDELLRLRLDDLTPPHRWPSMEARWARMLEEGYIAGPYEDSPSEDMYLGVTFFALANVLPGRHLVAFAPAGWPDGETLLQLEKRGEESGAVLTPRELQVLQLAADGRKASTIGQELSVSIATVKTHLEHIYVKLGVGDRTAAVAEAMRLGMIV